MLAAIVGGPAMLLLWVINLRLARDNDIRPTARRAISHNNIYRIVNVLSLSRAKISLFTRGYARNLLCPRGPTLRPQSLNLDRIIRLPLPIRASHHIHLWLWPI